MKTLTRLLSAAALASLFALPLFAQDAAAPANPCESAERTDLYTKYYEQKKNTRDQAPAFETAKQYLAKYETACPDQYSQAVRKFHDAYAAQLGGVQVQTAFYTAVNAKDARKAIEAGKALAAKEPDNAGIYLLTAYTGYNGVILKGSPVFQDAAVTSETIAAANRAIEMLQAGKEPKDISGKVSWAPFKDREDALAWANFWAGALQYKTAPDTTAKHMIAVAQSGSTVKEEPTVYTILAVALEAERARLADEYKKFTEENDQSRIVLANINQIVDRQIDAYARAVAYAKPDDARRAEWMTILKELYKSRNNGAETGLDAKIAAVKTTPLLVTTPVTTPPPTPTPAPGNGQPVAEKKP
jgi:hypothetical protein